MTVANKVAAGAAAVVLTMAGGLVTYYEGMVPRTYADAVGIPTICYGHTGPDVTPGRVAKPGECEELLRKDLGAAYWSVQRCIGVRLQPHEAAALTSFVFNVGERALCNSTLARMANQGTPASKWCAQLDQWVYATKMGVKIKLNGLVKRRASERAICEGKMLWPSSIPTKTPTTRNSYSPSQYSAVSQR